MADASIRVMDGRATIALFGASLIRELLNRALDAAQRAEDAALITRPTGPSLIFGDSKVAGVNYDGPNFPAAFSEAAGQPWADSGVIAQTSLEAGSRLGAFPINVSLVGNVIPASGTVRLTYLDPRPINHTGPSPYYIGIPGLPEGQVQLSMRCTIAGVEGLLRRDIGGNGSEGASWFYFDRFVDGAEVSVPPYSVAIPFDKSVYQRSYMGIDLGYNDFAAGLTPEQSYTNLVEICRWSYPTSRHIFILEQPASFFSNDENSLWLRRLNALIEVGQERHGYLYVPVVTQYLTKPQACADAGLPVPASGSPDDLALRDGRLPLRLTKDNNGDGTPDDGLHLTLAGDRVKANWVHDYVRPYGFGLPGGSS